MNVRIKFFGMIAETIEKELLIFENFTGQTVGEVLDKLLEQHPQLNEFTYTVALNKVVVNAQSPLIADNEIAILPPFAGG